MGYNYEPKSVRESAILTTSYVPGTVIEDIKNNNQLVLLVDFTKGSLTSLELIIEVSDDNVNFYQETSEAFTAGEGVVSLANRIIDTAGKYEILRPIKAAFVRVSVKGTGTVTGSLCAVKALIGQV